MLTLLKSVPTYKLFALQTEFTWMRLFSEHGPNKPLLTLYTRDVCPLCEEAKFALKPYNKYVSDNSGKQNK